MKKYKVYGHPITRQKVTCNRVHSKIMKNQLSERGFSPFFKDSGSIFVHKTSMKNTENRYLGVIVALQPLGVCSLTGYLGSSARAAFSENDGLKIIMLAMGSRQIPTKCVFRRITDS